MLGIWFSNSLSEVRSALSGTISVFTLTLSNSNDDVVVEVILLLLKYYVLLYYLGHVCNENNYSSKTVWKLIPYL